MIALNVTELKLADLVSGIVAVKKSQEFYMSVPGDRLGKVHVEFGNGRVIEIDASESAIERFRASGLGILPEPYCPPDSEAACA